MPDHASAPEAGASPIWRLILSALDRLPQGAFSRLFGMVADLRVPRPFRGVVYGTFSKLVGVRLDEVDRELRDFESLNRFFVRRLAPGVHEWPEDPTVVASPVDGVIGAFGTIRSGRAIQAKGIDYSIADLLGGDAEQAAVYEGGLFLTIYLSPRHYHRIHTPVPGHVVMARHSPGRLFPVNAAAVGTIDALFARNERLMCTVAGAVGPLAVVAVGAYNVGRISAAFDPSWSGHAGGWITNRGTPPPLVRRYRDPIPVPAGSELMAFHLGSTVVLLCSPGVEPVATLELGREVRVGEPLARPRSLSVPPTEHAPE